MNQPRVWVLADDRAGNRAQCLGVADRLGVPYEVKEIRYNALVSLPNALLGASLLGVTRASKSALKAPWPDVVIAAGRRTAAVARHIKRKSPATKLMQLMWPDTAPDAFDCIVLPSHDRDHKDTGNILRVLGAPHRITAGVLAEARGKWQGRLQEYPAPRIALLAGGGSKHGVFAPSDWKKLGHLAAGFARNTGGSLLVTTSRRTGKEGESSLKAALNNIPHHVYGWQAGGENPYLGYLALADAVIVTADSISMCSEACASGKPVYLFQPSTLAGKHARFINTLIANGYAFPFSEEFTDEIRKPLKPALLDSAATAADLITQKWFLTLKQ